jgi:hypothetical protein
MPPALLAELLADPAQWSPALLRLIGDPEMPTDVRRAAVSGLGRSGLSALVLQPALLADEPPVAIHAWRVVAGLADAAELGVLATLPEHPAPDVAAQARFGLATIAHRHGIAGYELSSPSGPAPGATIPLREAADADVALLERVDRAELHGIAPEPGVVWRRECPRGTALLALDPALLADGGDRLATAPALLGVVALSGSVRLLAFSAPAGGGRFDVALCGRDGTVVGGGRCPRDAVAQRSSEPEPASSPEPPRSSRVLRSHSAILWPPWPIDSPASRKASLKRSL